MMHRLKLILLNYNYMVINRYYCPVNGNTLTDYNSQRLPFCHTLCVFHDSGFFVFILNLFHFGFHLNFLVCFCLFVLVEVVTCAALNIGAPPE